MLSHFNCIQLYATVIVFAVADQASQFMGFSRQENWNGLPCPLQGNLPHPGIKPTPLLSPALAGGFFTTSTIWEAFLEYRFCSVQFSSVAHSCPTFCDPMNRSTPGLPVHHDHPEFTQTHVHRVCDAIQPSHPPSFPSPPAPNPSQHQGFFQ